MEAASTVESARIAAESCSAVKLSATVESARRPARRNGTMHDWAWPTNESRTAVESGAAPIVDVIPRASADEDAADKPVRTVVTIGRACVRWIRIVAVDANRLRANVGRTDSNCNRSHRYANANLRLRRRCRNH